MLYRRVRAGPHLADRRIRLQTKAYANGTDRDQRDGPGENPHLLVTVPFGAPALVLSRSTWRQWRDRRVVEGYQYVGG